MTQAAYTQPSVIEWEPEPDLVLERPAWQAQAACKGADTAVFYVKRGQPMDEAKRICSRCPVRTDCLEWALDHHERFGVWGGESQRSRARLALLRDFRR